MGPTASTTPSLRRRERAAWPHARHGAPARAGDTLLVLAFSGGGTRAAAFSYGVLEALRDIEVTAPDGRRTRLLDQVGVIAGVSGGSFTALAYGLQGDKLFDDYETRFLKRNVQGELLDRLFNPGNWGALWSTGWGRSELAADYYDEILFDGATYADLMRRPGPLIVASATDVSSGARFYFTQVMFDILCSDLSAIRLSRAAAASSAVPVVLSPVTINNYGGSCGYREPAWVAPMTAVQDRERPAARVMQEVDDLRAYDDGKARPYIHLVDGGVSDNLAMRAVLEVLDQFEAMRYLGLPTPMDRIKRVALVIVNSLSKPQTGWDRLIGAPGPIEVLLQATGVPIDHYSFEAIDQARDTAARWQTYRAIRDSGAIADKNSPALRAVERGPDTELYVIDVSFAGVKDAAEREFLNAQPTSFVLSAEAVDRLRAAARTVLTESTEFQRLLAELGHRGSAATAP
ncbi:MAG TPA: patatin-like phospholipase family protein [Burkholderiaceae bacterium]|nr:patatin-like phospholipase family protein [Burkholderiaceae bacterium]